MAKTNPIKETERLLEVHGYATSAYVGFLIGVAIVGVLIVLFG